MRIYLAGPMSGKPDFNFPAFDVAAKMLRTAGHEVFNPADADREKWGENVEVIGRKATYAECMRLDLNWIIDHAEGIALLPDWDQSKGAQSEYWLAMCLGLTQFHLQLLPDFTARVEKIISFTRNGRQPHMNGEV